MTPKTSRHWSMEPSKVQPNPGWGKLCEFCLNRLSYDDNQLPCSKVKWIGKSLMAPDLYRLSTDGQEVWDSDRFGYDYQEKCDEYTYDGTS